MAETPQPTPQVESAPPPPTPEAPAAGTNGEAPNNNVSAGINLESQIRAAEAAGESSDQAQVETFTNLANRGSELAPDAVDGELNAMIDQEKAKLEGAADNTTDDAHDIDSQQARLEEMYDKTPDELQKLAAEGNILAKRVLSDINNQASEGQPAAEAVAQQPSGQPEAPAQNDSNQPGVEIVTPSVQPEVPGEKPQLAEETVESVTSAAEQITKDAAENPTATSESTTPAPEAATEDPNAPEGETGKELTDAEKIVQERKLAAESVQSLAKLGVDINSEEGQKVIDLMAENPQYAEAFKLAAEAAEANQKIAGNESAAAASTAQAEVVDKQLEQAKKDGNEEEVKRLGFLKMLLIALGVALMAASGAAAKLSEGLGNAGQRMAK